MRDVENSYLSAGPGEEDGLAAVVGHSITYRIAVGPNEGRKVFTLQTVAPAPAAPAGDERLAKHSGFSLHAGVAAAAHQRDKVERLCRYIAPPVVATVRSPVERHLAMTWAQRLKRVFCIDIEQCERCGGKARIIARIEDPQVIGRILSHLQE